MAMLHVRQINEITTLCITTEGYWRHANTDDHDLRFIKRVLSDRKDIKI